MLGSDKKVVEEILDLLSSEIAKEIDQEIIRMLALTSSRINFLGIHGPTQWSVYEVIEEVIDWILIQPTDNWRRVELPGIIPSNYQHYAVSPELETWMKLKYK